MLKAFCDHAKGQSLHARDRFVSIGAVAHHAGQCRHLRQPPTIVFAFELDGEHHRHHCTIPAAGLHDACQSPLERAMGHFWVISINGQATHDSDTVRSALSVSRLVAKTATVLASGRGHQEVG